MVDRSPTVEEAVSVFGAAGTAELTAASAGGEPEDQLRSPFEELLADLCGLAGCGGRPQA